MSIIAGIPFIAAASPRELNCQHITTEPADGAFMTRRTDSRRPCRDLGMRPAGPASSGANRLTR